MATKNNPNELYITRIYDAPVETVWEAWTDPKQVAQWWGPRGFTLTTHDKDLRPGGFWRYTMHGPDGVDYPNKTVYLEVEKHAKLVYDHGGNDDRPPMFRVTVLFSKLGDRTQMEMTMSLPTPEAAEQARQFIKQAGGDSTWDRLAEYLEREDSGKEKFVINRSFNAPIALIYEMWTTPRHLAQWLPPAGFTMHVIRADIRPGGNTFFLISNAAGMKMYGRTEYFEMRKPDHLVYTQQFVDEDENISRHPLSPAWPETMLVTVTLAEEGPKRTRVTVTSEAHGAFSREELATFIAGRAGMTQGWGGSFDKLEAYLELN